MHLNNHQIIAPGFVACAIRRSLIDVHTRMCMDAVLNIFVYMQTKNDALIQRTRNIPNQFPNIDWDRAYGFGRPDSIGSRAQKKQT